MSTTAGHRAPRSNEGKSIAAGRGRWGDPTFPKSGWQNLAVLDLGAPCLRCEACQSTRVRFVHLITHPEIFGQYRVGCICAGNLTGDPAGAQDRDARARAVSTQRARWTSRKWRVSRAGNLVIRHRGSVITVYRVGGGYSASLRQLAGGPTYLATTHQSAAAAQLAAFDAWIADMPARDPGAARGSGRRSGAAKTLSWLTRLFRRLAGGAS